MQSSEISIIRLQEITNRFTLNSRIRHKRVEVVLSFIEKAIRWNSAIFSDEVLHGIDSFYYWIQKNQSPSRIKQITRSRGIMFWAMILPNGLLSYEILTGKQKSSNYIDIIKNKALPIMKINMKDKFVFQ